MKRVLIIGGSSGIGAALTQQLAEAGNEVLITYRSHQPASAPHVLSFPLDILADDLDLSFASGGLDGLVYCPGQINLAPFHRLKPQSFVDDFNLQVTGAIKVLQAAKAYLNENASIVLFSSVAATTGFNFHTQVSVSKGAIEGLTKALAAEWAPKVRVNAVAPSITRTPLAEKFLNTEEKINANVARHPLKSIGKAEDVAALAAFLISDNAKWMTGQIITIDGGISDIHV